MFIGTYKVIGILGGMGPEATADLYKHIISLTPVQKDQDHIPVLIFSNPKIPDRTATIGTPEVQTVIRYLQEGAKILESGGADFIIVPCNTAHIYYNEIQNSVKIPVLHTIRETVKYINRNFPGIKKVSLLATSGTLKTVLYQQQLEAFSINVIVPDEKIQNDCVMKAVYDIKAGKDIRQSELLLLKAIQSLDNSARRVVIMGCTEIPLALKNPPEGVVLINPAKILAELAVRLIRENQNDASET